MLYAGVGLKVLAGKRRIMTWTQRRKCWERETETVCVPE
jgi:hypothetical protein